MDSNSLVVLASVLGTLTAAIAAAIRDAERAGWEAGRDAAAAVCDAQEREYETDSFVRRIPGASVGMTCAHNCARFIRALTPPTTGGQP